MHIYIYNAIFIYRARASRADGESAYALARPVHGGGGLIQVEDLLSVLRHLALTAPEQGPCSGKTVVQARSRPWSRRGPCPGALFLPRSHPVPRTSLSLPPSLSRTLSRRISAGHTSRAGPARTVTARLGSAPVTERPVTARSRRDSDRGDSERRDSDRARGGCLGQAVVVDGRGRDE
jgi:hypothetical protein